MWVRLNEPCALFYPARVEPAASVHSIGDPRGAQLVRSGVAETVAQPPEQNDNTGYSFPRVRYASPEIHESNVAYLAEGLVAALGRPARRRRKEK
jgi:hypothetical protein